MTAGSDILRDIGRHEAELEALAKAIEQIQRAQEKQMRAVNAINRTLAEARGGWRTLMLVCGISGAAGAFTWKLLALLGYLR